MATWYAFLSSLAGSFERDAYLAGIPILVGRDEPFPKAKAIRIVRGDGGGEERLRARWAGAKKSLEIIIEAWEESQSVDPMAGYAKLDALETKIDGALANWADAPWGLSDVSFYAKVVRRTPANETITRPIVGSQITVQIDYV